MKICIFAAAIILSAQTSKAQNWDYTSIPGAIKTNSATNKVILDGTTKLGIGTTSPTEALTLNGNVDYTDAVSPGVYRFLNANSPHSGLYLNANNGWGNGASIMMNGNGNGNSSDGSFTFVSSTGSAGVGGGFGFWRYNNTTSTWESRMLITGSGHVLIGDVTDNWNYKLFVEQGILTEKLKVAIKTSAQWSDYVFDDKYDLKPLHEVESFIKSNRHLPSVPSAEDVVKEGIDMATMDATLLQKIEELTLYAIQQQKEIDELKRKLNK